MRAVKFFRIDGTPIVVHDIVAEVADIVMGALLERFGYDAFSRRLVDAIL